MRLLELTNQRGYGKAARNVRSSVKALGWPGQFGTRAGRVGRRTDTRRGAARPGNGPKGFGMTRLTAITLHGERCEIAAASRGSAGSSAVDYEC